GLLLRRGLLYVCPGALLGGRPARAELYHPEGWADYERMRATPEVARGLDRVLQGLARERIALLCAEEDPLDCHRGLMLTPALKERGVPPVHVRRGGRLEATAQMEQRLQEATRPGAVFPGALA